MVMLNNEPKIIVSDLNVFYGNKQAIFDINMSINAKEVTAFIGPSGCGKSTLLRCFNRMNAVSYTHLTLPTRLMV